MVRHQYVKRSSRSSNPRLAEISASKEGTRPLLDPFHLYNEKAAHDDRNFLVDCNESIDTMLVFVSHSFALEIII